MSMRRGRQKHPTPKRVRPKPKTGPEADRGAGQGMALAAAADLPDQAGSRMDAVKREKGGGLRGSTDECFCQVPESVCERCVKRNKGH